MIKRYILFFFIALFIHSLIYFFPTLNIKDAVIQEKDTKNKINTFRMVDLPVQKAKKSPPPQKKSPPPQKKSPPVQKKNSFTQKDNKPQVQNNENIQPQEPLPQNEPVTETTNSEEIPTTNSNEETFFHAAEVAVLPSLPVRLLRQRLHYPQDARRRGIEGVVYLQLYINSKGVVEKVEILQEKPNSSYGFGIAAKNALLGIKGTPAKNNGKAVGVIFRYPVRFTLEK